MEVLEDEGLVGPRDEGESRAVLQRARRRRIRLIHYLP